ncbi:MAG: hypothetical protein RR313_05690 [Anaerovoracaceae bacterium]
MNKQVNNESGFNKNLKAVNTKVPFKGWVPLTAVKTEADKQKYNDKGYQIGHTAKEFETDYPFVDTSKVFFSNDSVPCYYFDEDSLVLFVLPFYNKTYVSQTNESFEDWFARTISNEFTAVQENTLEYYELRLSSMFSFVSKSVKKGYLRKILAKDGLFEGAPELILTTYDACNYNSAEHCINAPQKPESLPDIDTVFAELTKLIFFVEQG